MFALIYWLSLSRLIEITFNIQNVFYKVNFRRSFIDEILKLDHFDLCFVERIYFF
jgi:hypothetical protein